MTGVLHHLAGLALGGTQPGAARLSLPSRFAPQAAHGSAAGWEPADGAEVPPPPAPASAMAQASIVTALGTAATHPDTTDREASAPRRDPDAAARPVMPAAARLSMTPADLQAARVPLPRVPARVEPAAPPPLRPSWPDPAARPDLPLGSRSTAPVPRAAESAAGALPIAAAPPAWTRQSHHAVEAPLRETVVAAVRAASATATPTVVHVTIDRIDVRAPEATRRAPEPRRPRPAPAVSLSDYLRDGAQGSRG